MSKREKYASIVYYHGSASERARTGVALVAKISDLSEEEVINNALQFSAELKRRKEVLVYQDKYVDYTSFDGSPEILLPDIRAEKIDHTVWPLTDSYGLRYRLSESTKTALGDQFPSEVEFEAALNTYVAVAGHVFMGEKVLTQQEIPTDEPVYQTTPIETKLPKQVNKTKKEPPYKGRNPRGKR